jgi:DNA (cytosine-5)-methyltransferase 1
MVYEFNRQFLSVVEEPQLMLFENDFESIFADRIEIPFESRGYCVNRDIDKIVDSKIQAIGFFSGAGGLDIGTQLAGVKVISSLDFDKDSVETMKANKYFHHTKHHLKDIKEVKANDYKQLIKENNPEKLILVGGPPCQPFSKAGYWVTHENRLGSDDPRNMFNQYLRIIEEIKPDGFLLENVESLLHPKNIHAAIQLEEAIERMGYYLIRYKANAIDFGIPQKRKRVFFLVSKKPITSLPKVTHGSNEMCLLDSEIMPYERVIDWIGKYDKPEFFEKEELTLGKTYSNELRAIPPGKNYIALTAKENYPNPKFIANKRFWTFLLKLHPNQPSWTIAAQPGPWVGPFHWTNRRLRVSEISAIQTFPEDYEFFGNRRSVQRQIGNAVPPLLGKAIVEHLIKFV